VLFREPVEEAIATYWKRQSVLSRMCSSEQPWPTSSISRLLANIGYTT
jgi:hypothetical protein